MSKKNIQKVLYAVIVGLLLLGSFFAGRLLNKPRDVQAQEILGDETRASASFLCDIDQVAIYSDRAHIRCTNSPGNGVYYFALTNNIENEMLINRVMAIGLANMSMNRYVYLFYDTSSTHNPSGCETSNCRLLLSAAAED